MSTMARSAASSTRAMNSTPGAALTFSIMSPSVTKAAWPLPVVSPTRIAGFFLSLSGGNGGVFRDDGETTTTIATLGYPLDLGGIILAYPSINESGRVAFVAQPV